MVIRAAPASFESGQIVPKSCMTISTMYGTISTLELTRINKKCVVNIYECMFPPAHVHSYHILLNASTRTCGRLVYICTHCNYKVVRVLVALGYHVLNSYLI